MSHKVDSPKLRDKNESKHSDAHQKFMNNIRNRDKQNKNTDKEQIAKDLKDAEFKWKSLETLGSMPPDDYTVTHINQNHDLLVWLNVLLALN